ncbi:MAG TPA: hypothetical protein VFO91_02185, partial [Anaerolineales bacterium]|nr:hypothetical protein [Anaerolineales bacterium]
RVIVVNRSPEQIPHVSNPKGTISRPVRCYCTDLKPFKLGEYFGGKIWEQTSLKHCPAGDTL